MRRMERRRVIALRALSAGACVLSLAVLSGQTTRSSKENRWRR